MNIKKVISRLNIGSAAGFDCDKAQQILDDYGINSYDVVNIVHENGDVYVYYWYHQTVINNPTTSSTFHHRV